MTAWIATQLARKFAPLFVVVLTLALLGSVGGWGVTAFKLGTARLETSTAKMALAQAVAEHEKFVAAAATFAAGVAERERQRDAAHQKRLLEIENERKQDEEQADARERRLAAEHRAGLVRVRAEVCESRGSGQDGTAGTTAAAGVGLRGAPVRENPAVLAVRVGAQADAEIRRCNAYVIAQAQRCPQEVAPSGS